MKRLFILFSILFASSAWGANGKNTSFDNDWARGYVRSIDSATTMTVLSAYSEFQLGEVLVVQSRDSGKGIIGFFQIESIMTKGDGQYLLKVRLIRSSKFALIQLGDTLYRMDFKRFNEEYRGNTELLMKNEDPTSSASYKSLVFMGLSVGETAQTLRKSETLINVVGYLDYGFSSRLTIGTILPADFFGAPNLHGKYKVHESDSNIASVGLNVFQNPETSNGVVNMNIYWDSVSSENVISHTNLSLALATFDKARNFTALKGSGTSSLQSGYEFILADWNRVLLGPSYNFENKSVGGYLTYMWVWDYFHALAGVSTTDVSKAIYNVQDGYYFNFDLFWRF